MLNKEKIRPSRSPYGAPLFFVKQQGQLRGVIDYRALNRITKRNNAPIPRPDDPWQDREGQGNFKTRFEILVQPYQVP